MRVLIIISLFGLLFLTGCTAGSSPTVYDDRGNVVGTFTIESENEAAVTDRYNQDRGRIRGSIVRDETGGRIGSVSASGGNVLILDQSSTQIGSLRGEDCFGEGNEALGRVTNVSDPEAAGGACLLLLVSKELNR